MRVELTEHPKGNKRFEILLGDTIYVISLEEGKKLADLINEALSVANVVVDECLHPNAVSAVNEVVLSGRWCPDCHCLVV